MGLQKLIIIGAGPKAMAIASKNSILRHLGFEVPEIHIIEKHGVGANWTGCSGYTNGRLELGTSPEKDVGFPYQSTSFSEEVNSLLDQEMKSFSWQNFLIAKKRYSAWVDRGRPAPQHREWAQYLQWVAKRLEDEIITHRGEVFQLRVHGNQWEVGFRGASGQLETLVGDGLVVTGPGRVRLEQALPNHDALMTVENFWSRYSQIANRPTGKIAVVGTGETAAAIVMSLIQTGAESIAIDIISPTGMTYSRGESYRENRVYSNADSGNWDALTLEDRRQFIKRTDRGVFSLYAQRAVDRAENIQIVPGRLRGVRILTDGRLNLHSEYNGRLSQTPYDFVVVATGADQVSFLRNMMDEESIETIRSKAKLDRFDQSEVEMRIAHDLSIANLQPKLHLPMLSGVMQGPGFANLSCLGRLSDRILSSYLVSEAKLRSVS